MNKMIEGLKGEEGSLEEDLLNETVKWQEKAESLAQLFMDNFKQYSDTEAGARLALAGPQLQKSAVEA